MHPAIMVHGGAGSGKYAEGDPRYRGLSDAIQSGLEAMKKGAAVDGVVAAVESMEGSGLFNCGRGSCLTTEGELELDAAVMSGDGLAGAGVGNVTCTYHPVTLSRWVMENTEHVLLVGERCRDYAKLAGMKLERLRPSEAAAARFGKMKGLPEHQLNLRLVRKFRTGDTVGAVALGSDGVPSAAVSTGGRWMKLPGRVGDSAILGAGIFADPRLGAASATGSGEDIIRVNLSMRACELIGKEDAQGAAKKAVALISRVRGKGTAGIITVDLKGRVGAAFNTEAMGRAWWDRGKGKVVATF